MRAIENALPILLACSLMALSVACTDPQYISNDTSVQSEGDLSGPDFVATDQSSLPDERDSSVAVDTSTEDDTGTDSGVSTESDSSDDLSSSNDISADVLPDSTIDVVPDRSDDPAFGDTDLGVAQDLATLDMREGSDTGTGDVWPLSDTTAGDVSAGEDLIPDCADSDGDGICDTNDLCDGYDDTIDLNDNAVLDCLENELSGGQFASSDSLADWSNTLEKTWVDDLIGNPNSGAMSLFNDCDFANGFCVLSAESTCFDVQPGDEVQASANYFISSSQPGTITPEAGLNLLFRDKPCSQTGQFVTNSASYGSIVDALSQLDTTKEAPPGAASVVVLTSVGNRNRTDGSVIVFDNILLRILRCDDTDNDGICEEFDLCPGLDDTIDIDDNEVSDCLENEIPDGQFRTADSLDAWTKDDVLASWSADLNGDIYSGAVVVSHTCSEPEGCTRYIDYCFLASPGDELEAFVQYFSPDEPDVGSGPAGLVAAFSKNDCAGFFTGTGVLSTNEDIGGENGVLSLDGVVPANTTSVHIRLNVKGLEDQGMAVIYDNLLVRVTGCADNDGDGVCDGDDVCAGEDDTIDIDGNEVSDCLETVIPDAQFPDDESLSNWVNPGYDITLTDDLNGNPNSGAMRFESLCPTSLCTVYINSACFAVQPGQQVDAYLNYYLPAGQPAVGFGPARLNLVFSSTACPAASTYVGNIADEDDTEGIVGVLHASGQAPSGSQSVRFNIGVVNPGGSQSSVVYYDNALFRITSD
ncbi:MAG: hypothetical protein KC561_11520 [Myxococcales bacterium]|nr:hypothetical protein [Myxococcales bacterium]